MRNWRLMAVIGAMLALAGCEALPWATQWKLRNFDLASADLSKLKIALRMPAWVHGTPESAVLIVREKDALNSEGVKLRAHRGPSDDPGLTALGGEPNFTVYEFTGADLAKARRLQAEAIARRTEGGATRKAIEISRGVACREHDAPDGPVLVDIYLHTDMDDAWLPLFESYDIAPAVAEAVQNGTLDLVVPRCGRSIARNSSVAD